MKQESLYAKAGVDIEKANKLVKQISSIVSTTYTRGVITEIGGFAGLFAMDNNHCEEPVLVSSTDGVGTKLMIAFMTGRHDTVGIDLVAMCVNDVIVTGAQPLFFLDYFATGKLQEETAATVIKGIAEGCKQAGCALIGGETAEMPGMYPDDEYDLAGFAVGVVDRNKIIDGSEIGEGHKIIGLASSGLHSNGFSLVRKIFFDQMGLAPDDTLPELGKRTIGEELLEPTKIYARVVNNLNRTFKIDGIVHVTGGGFQDNISRVLPHYCKAVIDKGSWTVPPVFKLIKKAGGVSEEEMLRTFNCGIGLIMIVPSSQTKDVLLLLKALKEEAFVIGRIEKRAESESKVEFTGDTVF